MSIDVSLTPQLAELVRRCGRRLEAIVREAAQPLGIQPQ